MTENLSKYKLVPESIVDELAQFIRQVDGNNKMGAGALADKICERFRVVATAVQGEPVGFCEDAALSIAERTFSTDVDEQLASDIIQYAQRLHSLYAAPQPEKQQPAPSVSGLVEALERVREQVDGNIRETVRDCVNGRPDVQDIYEYCDSIDAIIDAARAQNGESLARRFHEIYERLAPTFGYQTRDDTKQFDPKSANGRLMVAVCKEILAHPLGQLPAPDVSGLVEALERFVEAWTDCQQQPVHAEEFEILTDICEDSLKLLAAHHKQGGES